jgi:hypothetical protein
MVAAADPPLDMLILICFFFMIIFVPLRALSLPWSNEHSKRFATSPPNLGLEFH